jgi:dihydropteroate synthase
VPPESEIARTRPVIEALVEAMPLPVCIDTRKAEVAREALRVGARVVNDVSGGRVDPALLKVAAESEATLILSHLRGVPETMQVEPHFDDVLKEVSEELAASVARAEAAGVARERLVVDPGIGFGKRLEDNLRLLANAGWLGRRLGLPLLVGPSRKSFLGELTGDAVDSRETATAAACAVAIFAGANAVRVHHVAAARRVAAVAQALRTARSERA